MRKNTLYTVNKWNKPAFMPEENLYPNGGAFWKGLQKNLTGAMGSTVGNIAGGLIGNGYTTENSGLVSGISGILQAIPTGDPVTNFIKNTAVGIGTGLYNRAAGTKWDQEGLANANNAIDTTTASTRGLAGSTTAEDYLMRAGMVDMGNDFTQESIGKDGWFAHKAADKYNELKAKQDAARAAAANALAMGAQNVDRIQDDLVMSNFYGDGGGIHIKKANRGKFTAQAKRAGMGVQEYAAHVLANKSKYPSSTVKRANFARNAAKWKHEYGGPMSYFGSGALGIMQNDKYIDAINHRSDMIAKSNQFSTPGYGGLGSYAFGGELGTNGTDFTNGLLYVDAGGSHEENPMDGVLMGIDEQGIPNLVEEGETVFNDYVFSDRMKVPKSMQKELGLGGSINKKGITFAEASKKLAKESEQRPNDPISQDGLEASLARLAEVQEAERMKKEMREYVELNAYGGNLFAGGGEKKRKGKYGKGRFGGGGAHTMLDYLDTNNETVKNTLDLPLALIYDAAFNTAFKDAVSKGNNEFVFNGKRYSTELVNDVSNYADEMQNSETAVVPQDSTVNDFLQTVDDSLSRENPQNVGSIDSTNLRNPALEDIYIGDSDTIDTSRGGSPMTLNYNSISDYLRLRYPNNPNIEDDAQSIINYLKEKNIDIPKKTDVDYAYVDLRNQALTRDYPEIKTRFGGRHPRVAYEEGIPTSADSISSLSVGNLSTPTTKLIRNSKEDTTASSEESSTSAESASSRVESGNKGSKSGSAGVGTGTGVRGRKAPSTSSPAAPAGTPETAQTNPTYTDTLLFGNDRSGKTIWDYNATIPEGLGYVEGQTAAIPLSPAEQVAKNRSTDNRTVTPNDTGLGFNVTDKTPEGGVMDEGTGTGEGNPYQTWMRYVPAVGAGIMTLTDALGLTNKPDYTYADKLEAAARQAGYTPNIHPQPIGNYLTYRPMDIWAEQNRMDANARATDRAIMNSSNPSRMAGLLASGYNNQVADGELYRKALEYNDAKRQQVADFNRKTDMFNSQMGLEAAMANARYNQAAKQYQLSGLAQAAALRDSIDQRVSAARAANITNLLNSLGDIGRENFVFNQVEGTRPANNGWGYEGRNGWMNHYISAEGGKLKKKNKR